MWGGSDYYSQKDRGLNGIYIPTKREKKRMRRQRYRRSTPQRIAKRGRKKKWRPKSIADILFHNRNELIGTTTIGIDATHQFTVAEFSFGYIFECESMDEKDLLERETLFSRDGKVWTLLGRYRSGPCHNDDKWYPRDTTYPIGCKVRL